MDEDTATKTWDMDVDTATKTWDMDVDTATKTWDMDVDTATKDDHDCIRIKLGRKHIQIII